jgi:hypothetical protein
MARVVLMGSSDAAVELTGALAARLRARYIDGDELRPPRVAGAGAVRRCRFRRTPRSGWTRFVSCSWRRPPSS